jgi:hypothetical protein
MALSWQREKSKGFQVAESQMWRINVYKESICLAETMGAPLQYVDFIL